MTDEQKFTCVACGREFLSTPEDVELAAGHLCIAADRGLTQREAIEEIQRVEGGSQPRREPGMSIDIFENKDGYAPSQRVVSSLLRRAKKAGLLTDYNVVSVLESGDLLFGRARIGADDMRTTIIAGKRNGRWKFFTDTYLELKA